MFATSATTPTPLPDHRLGPLLRPLSLAVVGATPRPGSVGNTMLRQVLAGGFPGRLYAVNPRHASIEGVACLPSLADLPEPAEHVAFAIGDEAIEAELVAAIRQGARAATIVSALDLPKDTEPRLKERIRAIAREAGLALCGGNGMGFYNFQEKLWLCGFPTRPDHRPGGAVLLTHSGSLFTAIVDAEARIDYGLAVSTGQELTTTLADYMDYALDQPWTRVIGLFMESARDPAAFETALAKADDRGVPVVALKVGRSEASARLAVSHSGAIAGDHAAYAALFDRYGVGEVRSIDELAAALMVLGAARDIGPGGLATSHDSGGERGLICDLAVDHGVAFARLSAATEAALRATIEHNLEPVNPLDHWGSGRSYPVDFVESFRLLAADPDTAIAALVLDRWIDGEVMADYVSAAQSARQATGKPVFIVSNHRGTGDDGSALAATRAGVPVLDTVPAFLVACRLAFQRRDVRGRPRQALISIDAAMVARWRQRLGAAAAAPRPDIGGGLATTAHIGSASAFDEAGSLALLADFGVPVAPHTVVENRVDLLAAAARLGFPVVLKSAAPGLAHKSDVGGVVLGLDDAVALAHAYDATATRLGPRVLVARMVEGPRVEMLMGMTRDPDFGPLVLVGAGGVHAEVLRDVIVAKPPFDAAHGRRLIGRLRLRPLLDGVRGAPPADVDALAEVLARFSGMVAALGEVLAEIDVNPLMVLPDGVVAVDALVVPAAGRRPPAGGKAP